ncbi:MAG: hypothetical protein ACO2PM_24945 [Pyrobaculum sp.]
MLRLFHFLLPLLLFSLYAAYVDKIYISLRQCLCLKPQWLYLEVKPTSRRPATRPST